MGSKRVADPDPVRSSRSSLFTTKKRSVWDIDFGSIWGSVWDAFWLHFDSLLAPGSLLDALGFKNGDFLENVQQTIEYLYKCLPGTPQNKPKSAQVVSKKQLFRSKISTSFLDRFGPHLASQNASLGHPLGDQNRSKNRSEIGLLKKSAQDRRRTAQDLPQTPPRAPPDPPGRPKMAPRCPRELPKAPQDALEAPFCTPGFHKKRRRPPGAAGTDFTCAPRSPKTPTKIQDRSKRAPQAPSPR